MPEDPYGNTYMRGVNYSVFSFYSGWKDTFGEGNDTICGKAEYAVDRKYSKLTMKLNPYKDMGENGWGYVKVFADNKLVATSEVIRQKTRQTVEFEVDIAGATYIEVEPIARRGYGYKPYEGYIIMWDVKLWR